MFCKWHLDENLFGKVKLLILTNMEKENLVIRCPEIFDTLNQGLVSNTSGSV
jgi:hypothetical protein